ncbi:DinB family protein [Arachidicoccus terrestris]|uniref:DinB family protein n=1 Tax=Arachidicoccus terrestris TaxID=2875539 RepID=UPI001CC34A42|nr:DinB family protein [Arachidicoccus terrestris]UAY56162.1 DUF1572 family protein [Arachidicoccus terrestris]
MENTADQLGQFMMNAYFGKNWTEVDFKHVLSDVTLEEANTKIDPLNTIAGIIYHLDYYVSIVLKRLQGEMLPSNAKNGFDIETLPSVDSWQQLLESFYNHAEKFAATIRLMNDDQLLNDFQDRQYGNNIYNIQGIVEHAYYHMGQIVLLKKMIRSGKFV